MQSVTITPEEAEEALRDLGGYSESFSLRRSTDLLELLCKNLDISGEIILHARSGYTAFFSEPNGERYQVEQDSLAGTLAAGILSVDQRQEVHIQEGAPCP